MFRWYVKAAECYALLSDVPSKDHCSDQERGNAFHKSEWFQRGWTLQELLAPSQVIFVDCAWNVIGTKEELTTVISYITRIPWQCLCSRKEMYRASIAMRMSWASQRKTTRKEDLAYCLLGLFDVAMPLLYGEGKKAFLRLQLEIIKKSGDESIFAWESSEAAWGMLAPSPEAFEYSGSVVCCHALDQSKPYAMTNIGLKIRKVLCPCPPSIVRGEQYDQNVRAIALNCRDSSRPDWDSQLICLYVARIEGSWYRVNCGTYLEVNQCAPLGLPEADAQVLYIRQPGL